MEDFGILSALAFLGKFPRFLLPTWSFYTIFFLQISSFDLINAPAKRKKCITTHDALSLRNEREAEPCFFD